MLRLTGLIDYGRLCTEDCDHCKRTLTPKFTMEEIAFSHLVRQWRLPNEVILLSGMRPCTVGSVTHRRLALIQRTSASLARLPTLG